MKNLIDKLYKTHNLKKEEFIYLIEILILKLVNIFFKNQEL